MGDDVTTHKVCVCDDVAGAPGRGPARNLAQLQRGWSQLPLHQCAGRASGGGESAEVGGRELLVLTADDGGSCLFTSAQEGHLEVLEALLEVGGPELLVLTAVDGGSCLSAAREATGGRS
jgi:hypothetical protein